MLRWLTFWQSDFVFNSLLQTWKQSVIEDLLTETWTQMHHGSISWHMRREKKVFQLLFIKDQYVHYSIMSFDKTWKTAWSIEMPKICETCSYYSLEKQTLHHRFIYWRCQKGEQTRGETHLFAAVARDWSAAAAAVFRGKKKSREVC